MRDISFYHCIVKDVVFLLKHCIAAAVGIVAYTHFKLQEQRVERREMEEVVVCNGSRIATTGSSVDSDSLTDIQEI